MNPIQTKLFNYEMYKEAIPKLNTYIQEQARIQHCTFVSNEQTFVISNK